MTSMSRVRTLIKSRPRFLRKYNNAWCFPNPASSMFLFFSRILYLYTFSLYFPKPQLLFLLFLFYLVCHVRSPISETSRVTLKKPLFLFLLSIQKIFFGSASDYFSSIFQRKVLSFCHRPPLSLTCLKVYFFSFRSFVSLCVSLPLNFLIFSSVRMGVGGFPPPPYLSCTNFRPHEFILFVRSACHP